MPEIITLKNKIRLVYDYMPSVKTVAVGVFVKAGSAFEAPEQSGISHFIEHMIFKGTKTRTARDISYVIDAVGGEINAYTARELTCFYTKTLCESAPLCFELLSDMIFSSKFEDSAIKTEKAVVCDEIDMCEDAPEELVHDILNEICYPDHPIGSNILGTKQTVKSFSRQMILDYMKDRYCADTIVVSVAGGVTKDEVVSLAEKYFGNAEVCKKAAESDFGLPVFVTAKERKKKHVEQFNIAIALPAVERAHPDVNAVNLIGNILGGSASSRLFQHIREEKGLAYCVYSGSNTFMQTGYTSIYAACAPKNADTVMNLIEKEVNEIYKNSLTDEDIEFAKKQMKGSCIMGLEGALGVMGANGRRALLHGGTKTVDEYISEIEKISKESVKNASKLFDMSKASVAIVTQ